jgi:hypothetical protein
MRARVCVRVEHGDLLSSEMKSCSLTVREAEWGHKGDAGVRQLHGQRLQQGSGPGASPCRGGLYAAPTNGLDRYRIFFWGAIRAIIRHNQKD